MAVTFQTGDIAGGSTARGDDEWGEGGNNMKRIVAALIGTALLLAGPLAAVADAGSRWQ